MGEQDTCTCCYGDNGDDINDDNDNDDDDNDDDVYLFRLKERGCKNNIQI
jgi:hypothetical protein